jgi:hypothetical protein
MTKTMILVSLLLGCGRDTPDPIIDGMTAIEELYDPDSQALTTSSSRSANPSTWIGQLYVVGPNSSGRCPEKYDLWGWNLGSILDQGTTEELPDWLGDASDLETIRSVVVTEQAEQEFKLTTGGVLDSIGLSVSENTSSQLVVSQQTQTNRDTATWMDAQDAAQDEYAEDEQACWVYLVHGYTHLVVLQQTYQKADRKVSEGIPYVEVNGDTYRSVENFSVDHVFLLETRILKQPEGQRSRAEGLGLLNQVLAHEVARERHMTGATETW